MDRFPTLLLNLATFAKCCNSSLRKYVGGELPIADVASVVMATSSAPAVVLHAEAGVFGPARLQRAVRLTQQPGLTAGRRVINRDVWPE